MKTKVVQRWEGGRASYRPVGEPIKTRVYEVAAIGDDTTAKRFVLDHHYSGSYPSAKRRFGLYRREELVGVAVFATPQRYASLACLPGDPKSSVVLGRFVLRDEVPANGETWFLARAFKLLRDEGFIGVVSFSDPVARTDLRGRRVFPGHIGTIYQAHNAVYLGTSKSDWLRLLPDGTSISRRTISKIRNRERGARYAASILERHGAPAFCDDPDWLDQALELVTRRVRHTGNHKYAWTLQKRDRRHLMSGSYYPKEKIA